MLPYCGSRYISSFDYGYGYGYGFGGYGFGLGASVFFDDGPYIAPVPVPVVVDTVVVETPVVEAPVAYPPPAPPIGLGAEPAPVQGDDVQQAAALLRQGDDAFQQGRYEEARLLYVNGVLLDESNGFAHVVQMMPYFAMGEYGAAGSSLRRALTLEPTLIDQPLDARAMYKNSSDFDQQLAALQRHLARSPQDAPALLLISYLLYGTGDQVAAGVALDDLVRQQPGDTLAHLLRDAVARVQKGSGISSQPAPV